MSSLMQVDRKEWEEFLGKLSELEEKYRLVLQELDTARGRLQALDSLPKQGKENTSSPTVSPPAEKQPTQGKPRHQKAGFVTQLKTELRSLQISPTVPIDRSLMNSKTPRNYAYCSRCAGKIIRATRFCNHCGADFGKWMCSCGHELSDSLTYCKHCGRRVEEAT